MSLAPGAVIGIVGGGQLGRMTALAAARLGFRCHILAPEADSPAMQVTDRATVAGYDDPSALEAFANSVDVVTIEFENLPVAPLRVLAGRVPVRPSPDVLAICQDRRLEKRFLVDLEVPTAAFGVIETADDLAPALASSGRPAILKTARLGYDGKGQAPVGAGDDPRFAFEQIGQAPAIAEARVAFARELSVVTARGPDGRIVSYPPVENHHQNHVLKTTIAPAPIPDGLAAEAVALAERIARALDLVGVIAVEMFETQDGRLLVNELAPRPHNSGHWTIDACTVSQFEQLVRAVTALPLGAPEPVSGATMENLLGDEVLGWREILTEPGARLHLYGKHVVRPGRKLGHVTRLRR